MCVGFNTTLISTSVSDPSYPTISGTINSWDWDFGDSQNSCCVEDTIQHGYTTDGIYTAQLIVIDSYGCSDTITNPVIVNPGPIASFSADTVCVGDPTNFTNNSDIDSLGAAIASYLWDMGGSGNYVGGTSDTDQHPEFLYNDAGIYTVILMVTDLNGCQGYDTNTIIVDTLPIANFSATEVCHNDTTVFMDSSIGTSATVDQWSWNMGGSGTYVNGTSSTDDTTYYIYDNPGTYTVILTITDTNDCIHLSLIHI